MCPLFSHTVAAFAAGRDGACAVVDHFLVTNCLWRCLPSGPPTTANPPRHRHRTKHQFSNRTAVKLSSSFLNKNPGNTVEKMSYQFWTKEKFLWRKKPSPTRSQPTAGKRWKSVRKCCTELVEEKATPRPNRMQKCQFVGKPSEGWFAVVWKRWFALKSCKRKWTLARHLLSRSLYFSASARIFVALVSTGWSTIWPSNKKAPCTRYQKIVISTVDLTFKCIKCQHNLKQPDFTDKQPKRLLPRQSASHSWPSRPTWSTWQ